MRLIDADALMRFPIRLDHYDKENGNEHFVLGVESVLEYAENLPTIEARPVVRGEWLHDSATGIAFCSVCNMDAVEDGTNFCPECGADMRGDANDL